MFEELVEAHRLESGGDRHDTLVTLGARFAVEPGHRDDLDGHSLSLRLELDGVERLAGVLGVGDEDLLDLAATGLEEFEHGVASLDLLAAESLLLTRAGRAPWTADLTAGHGPTALARGPTGRTLAWRGTRRHDVSSNSATALAPIPSTRPRAPSPSAVVAFTVTSAPTTAESSSDMRDMYSDSFGRSAMIVRSAETVRRPVAATSATVSSSSRRDDEPANWGS